MTRHERQVMTLGWMLVGFVAFMGLLALAVLALPLWLA